MRRAVPVIVRLTIYAAVLSGVAWLVWWTHYRNAYDEALHHRRPTREPQLVVRPGQTAPPPADVVTVRPEQATAQAETQERRDREILDAIVRDSRGATGPKLSPVPHHQGQVVVAVLPTQRLPEDPAAAAVQRGVEDLLAVTLAGSDDVVVVDRSRVTQLLAEHKLALSGLTAGDYAVQAGQLLGASRGILVRTVPLKSDQWQVSATCYDIQSGRAVATGQGQVIASDTAATLRPVLDELQAGLGIRLRRLSPADIDHRPELSLHYMRAMTDLAVGEADRAILSLIRVNQLDPSSADAYYWKGVAYSRIDQPDHAAVEYGRYLERAGDGKYAQQARTAVSAWRSASHSKIPNDYRSGSME